MGSCEKKPTQIWITPLPYLKSKVLFMVLSKVSAQSLNISVSFGNSWKFMKLFSANVHKIKKQYKDLVKKKTRSICSPLASTRELMNYVEEFLKSKLFQTYVKSIQLWKKKKVEGNTWQRNLILSLLQKFQRRQQNDLRLVLCQGRVVHRVRTVRNHTTPNKLFGFIARNLLMQSLTSSTTLGIL